MLNYDSGDIINVGAAEDLTIAELAALVSEVVAYGRQIVFGASKPNGPPRKINRCLVIHFTLVVNQAILGLAPLAAKIGAIERGLSKASGGVH